MLRLVASVLLALLAALAAPCLGAEIHLDPRTGASGLLPSADVLRDPTGRWTPADVEARASSFRPASALRPDVRAHAFAPSTLWLRLRLRGAGGPWYLHAPPEVDRGELIVVAPDGATTRMPFGTMVPYAQRDHGGWLGNTVPLPPAATRDGTTYLRVVVREEQFGGLSVRPVLYEATTGRRKATDDLVVVLLPLGMILALGLLNGVLGVTLRDRAYVWYAAAMAAFVLYKMIDTNLAWRWLWPFASICYDVADYGSFVLYLALVAGFARVFLDLPRAAKTAWYVIVTAGAIVALEEALYVVWPNALDASGLASSLDPLASAAFLLAVFFAGIVAWRRGNEPARFYCIAFAGVAIGLIVGDAADYGIIPQTMLTDALPGIGVAWEALFLSIALADRIRVLSARASTLQGERDVLEAYAFADALTGVGNRRALDGRLLDEWRRGARAKTRLSIVLIDVDSFKTYNDAYGHVRGDRVLARVGECIAETLRRPDDFVARYGGEEFIVVLPGCSRGGAVEIAEAIRLAVRGLGIEHEQSPFGCVTISAGVASAVPKHDRKPSALVAAADRMLYAAKSGGRDRVASAPPRRTAPVS